MNTSRWKVRALVGGGILLLLLVALLIFWFGFYTPWAEKQKRPLHYTAEIEAAAAEFALDPYLITAMVYCESSFRADVVSHADAVGLMQVTPPTGEWIAEKLGIPDFDRAMLTDPGTNLRMGCWYVNFLLERYDGQVPEALTAYIAGQGDVSKWLNDPQYSQDGKTLLLDNLPGPDTRGYARKIMGVQEDYIRLYPDAYPVAGDGQ